MYVQSATSSSLGSTLMYVERYIATFSSSTTGFDGELRIFRGLNTHVYSAYVFADPSNKEILSRILSKSTLLFLGHIGCDSLASDSTSKQH